jgi:hypothetical protein
VRTHEVLPSLPSPSALPYQVAVAGCHSGSTTRCAAPEASAEPKRHAAAQTASDARSTAPAAEEEELEEAAMARAPARERAEHGGATRERMKDQQRAGTYRHCSAVSRAAGTAARGGTPPLFLGWDRF